MKRHLLGITLFIFAFTSGLLISPIRFKGKGQGHGIVIDGGGHYWFHPYRSMYFVDLLHASEGYDSKEKARDVFNNQLENPDIKEIAKQDIINRNEERAVIYFQMKNKLEGYCVFRIESNHLRNICSTSLWHVMEFEKQNYK